ncbi:MAG: fumarylacetoacetate hydrolase family protein [Alphaproteobacteria bacterium]|nr:fumarylacetoacetate hydrolase family protein [Alphaproteobacteria bacterium]
MKLATLHDGSRDGTLVVVRRDGAIYIPVPRIARTLQEALDRWDQVEPALQDVYARLNGGELQGAPVDAANLMSPLPRAYEWVDGSAYITHVVLVRKARNAEPPPTLETDPLVYQGGSGVFLSPRQDIVLHDEAWGLDYEAELCVVLGDTPLGTTADTAAPHIKLLMLCNDVTLRNLIPTELQKGFGFFQGKPATAFSPFAVTPDELGDAWRDGRVHLHMKSTLNGERAGDVHAGPEMHFSFFDLVQHICKTRDFTAGTILGSGTIANEDPATGSSCLSEMRMREIIATGQAQTRYMKAGDVIRIEMQDADGNDIFGVIEQRVVAAG